MNDRNDRIEVERICRVYGQQFADADGIFPAPGAVLDKEGSLSLYALAMRPEAVTDLAYKLCRDARVKEFFFTLDFHNRPDRREEYHSVLGIFHVRKGLDVRLGVMEYDWDAGTQTPVVQAVQWGDPFWTGRYGDLLARLEKQCGGPWGGMDFWHPWGGQRVVVN